MFIAPFGDAYEKIGTIQRRLAWPLHKDDTLFQSGRPTGLNIYFIPFFHLFSAILAEHLSTIFKEEDEYANSEIRSKDQLPWRCQPTIKYCMRAFFVSLFRLPQCLLPFSPRLKYRVCIYIACQVTCPTPRYAF